MQPWHQASGSSLEHQHQHRINTSSISTSSIKHQALDASALQRFDTQH
jgi:hypothetical protein